MIRSMTGFGRASLNEDGRELTVELKAVNHRFLDISFRFPRSFNFLEDAVRSHLAALISRGHIDAYAYYSNKRSDAKSVNIDTALLGAYLDAAKKTAEEFSLSNDITVSKALRFQDVLEVAEADEDTDALKKLMIDAVTAAAAELIAMRESEGMRIRKDLLERVGVLERIHSSIKLRAPGVVEDYRARLNTKIESILSEIEIDRARLATEVALFADRANIDEELVRLMSHFEALRSMLDSSECVGRKLDFLVQEINREFNTIGSKANDKEISALVIDGKAEIEKLREQVQNLE